MTAALPIPDASKKQLSAFEETYYEGRADGEKRGELQAKERMILIFMKKFPDWSDAQIAKTFGVELKFVQMVRAKLTKKTSRPKKQTA